MAASNAGTPVMGLPRGSLQQGACGSNAGRPALSLVPHTLPGVPCPMGQGWRLGCWMSGANRATRPARGVMDLVRGLCWSEGLCGCAGGPNVWPHTAELWCCQGMVVVWFMGLGVWGPGAVLPVRDEPEGRAVCWGGSAGPGPGALQRVLRTPITSQSGSTVPLPLSPHCPPPLCGAASLVLALERCAGTLPLGCHCHGHRCTRG